MPGVRLPGKYPVQFQIDGVVRRLLEEMRPGRFPTHDHSGARPERAPDLPLRITIT
jgi:hypothetical protein